MISNDLDAHYYIAPPDPVVQEKNKEIAKHTFLRSQTFVRTSEAADPLEFKEDQERVKAVDQFLLLFNGDWSLPYVQHFCTPAACPCSDRTTAASLMFGAAMAIDFLQASEAHRPSADEWGSCAHSAGVVAGASLVHSLLPRCFCFLSVLCALALFGFSPLCFDSHVVSKT